MVAGYRGLLGDASAQVMLLISREQSRRSLRSVSRAAE
jgi:biopolymer transport protein ExbB